MDESPEGGLPATPRTIGHPQAPPPGPTERASDERVPRIVLRMIRSHGQSWHHPRPRGLSPLGFPGRSEPVSARTGNGPPWFQMAVVEGLPPWITRRTGWRHADGRSSRRGTRIALDDPQGRRRGYQHPRVGAPDWRSSPWRSTRDRRGDDPPRRSHTGRQQHQHAARPGTDQSNGTLPLQRGTDLVVVMNTFAAATATTPAGSSGWHSHPGGAIVVVAQGEITIYRSVGSVCDAETYAAGQSFVERPNDVQDGVNTGTVPDDRVCHVPGCSRRWLASDRRPHRSGHLPRHLRIRSRSRPRSRGRPRPPTPTGRVP
jgi:quercetin dioxygenase-like cupin family protein